MWCAKRCKPRCSVKYRKIAHSKEISKLLSVSLYHFSVDSYCVIMENRLIVKKFFDQNLTPAEIFKRVKSMGITWKCVYRTVCRLIDTGSIQDRPRSGRPRTARTKDRVKRIREKIRYNPIRSGRKMAKDEETSERSMRRILKKELHYKPYKKCKRHGLSDKQRAERVKRAKMLLERQNAESVEKIVFSDEKLFNTEAKFNAQNDRIYALCIEDVSEKVRTVSTFQNKNSVMVWTGICQNGKLPLKFVDKGVKIDQEYYKNEILETTLLHNIGSLYPDGQWTFQQDSAPAHKAKKVQEWLRANCPNFISSEEWPACSPDLNPLDYCIWGTLEARVNATPHRSIESLKTKLVKEWEDLPMELVSAAIGCWRKRLALVIQHKGGRFE